MGEQKKKNTTKQGLCFRPSRVPTKINKHSLTCQGQKTSAVMKKVPNSRYLCNLLHSTIVMQIVSFQCLREKTLSLTTKKNLSHCNVMCFCPMELALQKNASRQKEMNLNLTHIQSFLGMRSPWVVGLVTIRIAGRFFCFSSWQSNKK